MKIVAILIVGLLTVSFLSAQNTSSDNCANEGACTGDCNGACCPDAKPGILAPRFGICTKPDQSAKMKAAGYDYVEAGVGWFLMPDKSDEEFLKYYLDVLKKSELNVEACNSFIPGNLKSTGPETNHPAILEWAETAFRRAKVVGIKAIVFGSGGSRKIPDGFSREEARAQFVDLLKKMGPIAQKYGVVVVIEPLNSKECNFINTVSEGTDIARDVNHPNIRMLADFYHMLRENEGPESIIKAGKLLYHCHIAENKDRLAPGTNGEDFTGYFKALKQIGYRGRISIEGRWRDFDKDLPVAIKAMQDQIAQVNAEKEE